MRSTAAPYTESRLAHLVRNKCVGFPVVEQDHYCKILNMYSLAGFKLKFRFPKRGHINYSLVQEFLRAWKEPSKNRVVVPIRQATKAGGIDSLESIPGLLKSLKILVLDSRYVIFRGIQRTSRPSRSKILFFLSATNILSATVTMSVTDKTFDPLFCDYPLLDPKERRLLRSSRLQEIFQTR